MSGDRYSVKCFDTIILRTPLLAVNKFFPSITDENSLKTTYQNPVIQEALYLASPVLFEQLQEWQNGKLFDAKDQNKLTFSLMRYLLRMACRPTPFGMFAGVSSLSFTNTISNTGNNKSFIELAEINKYQKNLRLDMQVISALINNIEKDEFARKQLKYHVNNSLYRIGNQFRYNEYYYENQFRRYQTTAIDCSEYTINIIELAKLGISIYELCSRIITTEKERETVSSFINQLIEAQVLVSELEPTITGTEISSRLKERLATLNDAKNICQNLNIVITKIDNINKTNPGLSVEKYKEIEEDIKKMEIAYEKAKLFQMDLYKPIESACISANYSKTIIEGIGILKKLNPPFRTTLDAYREAFYERYEEQEISLLQVLDMETGIGFPVGTESVGIAPLTEDIYLANNLSPQNIEWLERDTFLFNIHQKALQKNLYEIELDKEKINALPDVNTIVPDSFSAMGSIVFENEKEYLYLHSVGGTGAINLLGRFCHIDNEIEKLCQRIAQEEQSLHPEKIRAEIVHVPESRMGNILQRPVLSEYEIPYLGQASVAPEYQISVSDLMVSVRDNKIVLRSKRLNKEIMPVLSSAHNYSTNSLPVYHFLCSLQSQGISSSLGFHWGVMKEKHNFLPRITMSNLILSPATWQQKAEDYFSISKAKDEQMLKFAVEQWRNEHRIPKYIAIADGDNELTLNLENNLCLQVLQDTIKKRPYITLVESFINESKSFVRCGEDLFTHQMIFSFYKEKNNVPSYKATEEEKNGVVKRSFIPGNEWVYYKFYCGAKTLDSVLSKAIKPLINQLINQGIIESWFFIRYSDPKNHLRLRMKLASGKTLNDILSRVKFFMSSFLSHGLIYKIQLDTYYREIERYGGETIIEAEKLFFNDSESYLNIQDELKQTEHVLKAAIINVDYLLTDFGLTLSEKKEFALMNKESFYQEFNLIKNQSARNKLNDKFRMYKNDIKNALDGNDISVDSIYKAYQKRSEMNSPITALVKNQLQSKIKFENFISSIIHMSLNRLFTVKQRQQEFVVYDLLSRHYTSLAVRETYKKEG